MTKLENTRNWMSPGERNALAEAADKLLDASAEDFQLAIEALLARIEARGAGR